MDIKLYVYCFILVCCVLVAFLGGVCFAGKRVRTLLGRLYSKCKANSSKLQLYSRWVEQIEDGKSFVCYLRERDVEKVAIYGMNEIGITLLKQLKNEGVEVLYGIDRMADKIEFTGIDIRFPSEIDDSVDLIIVTALNSYKEIKDTLKVNPRTRVLSLMQIIDEL